MVEGVNTSTSKLLEQIRRLSAQPSNTKEVDTSNFKNEVESSVTKSVNDIRAKVNVSQMEKVSKKNDVSVPVMDGVKVSEARKSVHPSEIAHIPNVERKRYKEPLGNLLDAYL
ncbi:MAG: hypothetical protein HW390_2196 [Candidatus Brocadiaceae bacterium]|nr:hypothetical protein [Candidatus Brocadiaceae bacterium]